MRVFNFEGLAKIRNNFYTTLKVTKVTYQNVICASDDIQIIIIGINTYIQTVNVSFI